MKSTVLLLMFTLAVAPCSFARFSKLVILTPSEKQPRHQAYHPRLTHNPQSADFVDVRIPWVDDGKSYWLVLASAKLSDDDLEFRTVFRGAGMPSHILAFTPLAQQVKWKGGRSEKKPGFIELTLHRSQVRQAYIYHDFWNPMVLDGGFYYTVKLGEYPVEQGGAEIHEAAGAGDLARVKTIVQTDPRSVTTRDPYGMTPLHWAVAAAHEDMVKFLLGKGANVDAVNVEGFTSLHFAAKLGNKPIAEVLIVAGADVNATNNVQHVSPLNKAAQNGKLEVVKLLVEKGADIDSEESNGRCPLQWASGEMAKYLITQGAKVDLFSAIRLGDITNMTAMLTADPSLLDKGKGGEVKGITPLYWAVMHGQSGIVRSLIARGADVNAKDDNGLTPLHQAAWHGFSDIADLLVSKGANVNATSADGASPLKCAKQLKHTNVVQILRRYQAKE